MPIPCDVCGGSSLHYTKDVEGKLKPILCPYYDYKKIKGCFTPEIRGLFGTLFFDENILLNDLENLKNFKEMVPSTTSLFELVQYGVIPYLKNALIVSPIKTFYMHFTRFLIETYIKRKYSYIEVTQEPSDNQFTYLWLDPTKLRESYFNQGSSKFKNLSSLSIPSLVIYPLGAVKGFENKAWGDIVSELITHRSSEGKATWIIQSKSFEDCREVTSSLEELLEDQELLELESIAGITKSARSSSKKTSQEFGAYF